MTVLSLAGHSLRELTVSYDLGLSWNRDQETAHACAVRRLLSALSSRSPGLQSLCVYDNSIHPASHIMGVGRLRELRSLRMKFESDDTWLGPLMHELADLDHLRDLSLPMDIQLSEKAPIQEGFPQLRRLRFAGHHCNDMKALDSLAKIMPPTRLQRLDVVDAFADSFTETCSHLDDFVAACAGTLTTIHLKFHHGPKTEPPLPSPLPALRLLRPFMELHGLRSFRLSFAGKLSLTDDDLCKIQGAWPLLEALTVTCRRAGAFPTIQGIVGFLSGCPHLSVLELPALVIKGKTVPFLNVKVFPSDLKVEDERIHDPGTLAEVLRSVFPNVRVSKTAVKRARGRWGVVMTTLNDNFETSK